MTAPPRLQPEAAMHGSGGAGQDPTVGRKRRGHGPADQHVQRVLEAVVRVRPDTDPAGGCGG